MRTSAAHIVIATCLVTIALSHQVGLAYQGEVICTSSQDGSSIEDSYHDKAIEHFKIDTSHTYPESEIVDFFLPPYISAIHTHSDSHTDIFQFVLGSGTDSATQILNASVEHDDAMNSAVRGKIVPMQQSLLKDFDYFAKPPRCGVIDAVPVFFDSDWREATELYTMSESSGLQPIGLAQCLDKDEYIRNWVSKSSFIAAITSSARLIVMEYSIQEQVIIIHSVLDVELPDQDLDILSMPSICVTENAEADKYIIHVSFKAARYDEQPNSLLVFRYMYDRYSARYVDELEVMIIPDDVIIPHHISDSETYTELLASRNEYYEQSNNANWMGAKYVLRSDDVVWIGTMDYLLRVDIESNRAELLTAQLLFGPEVYMSQHEPPWGLSYANTGQHLYVFTQADIEGWFRMDSGNVPIDSGKEVPIHFCAGRITL